MREILRNGLRALRNLAVNIDNQVARAASGRLELVQQVTHSHPLDIGILRNGLYALVHLMINPANQVAFAASGGLELGEDAEVTFPLSDQA